MSSPLPFSDFPEDIQLNILSFLPPEDISAFARTCRRYSALCSFTSPSADLWLAICDRRWGCKTQIGSWSAAPSHLLYKTLEKWEQCIGFWFDFSLYQWETKIIFHFEWSSSCIICYRVEPSSLASPYSVSKIPFLWLGLSPTCETLGYLHLGCRFGSLADLDDLQPNSDVIKVNVSLRTESVVSEESSGLNPYTITLYVEDSKEVLGLEGSPPDRLMLEIYRYFSSRKCSGGEKFSSRNSKKKCITGRRKWYQEFFYRYCYIRPTPLQPLQGLWKGISKNMNLEFYLVTYVNDQQISCYIVRDMPQCFPRFPIFTTSTTPFLPFSKVEQVTYSMLKHIGSVDSHHFNMERGKVSRILAADSSGDHINVEGRIWEYEDGTFGFLQNDFIVDLKPFDFNGCLLDVV